MVVVTCFHSNFRYHPAHCTSVASSSLVAHVKVDDVDVDVDVGDADMAMEVQTIIRSVTKF